MASDAAWEWLLTYEPGIRALARRAARRDQELADELWDLAVDRVPDLVDSWDEAYGVTVWGYVYSYLWRWFSKRKARKAKLDWRRDTSNLDEAPSTRAETDQEMVDEVLCLLAAVGEEHGLLLLAKYWKGMTLQDIADELGVSKGTAVARFERAREAAREWMAGRRPCDG